MENIKRKAVDARQSTLMGLSEELEPPPNEDDVFVDDSTDESDDSGDDMFPSPEPEPHSDGDKNAPRPGFDPSRFQHASSTSVVESRRGTKRKRFLELVLRKRRGCVAMPVAFFFDRLVC